MTPPSPLKIYIIAGEASGDIYGAALINALKIQAHCEFYGVGGPAMIKAGFASLFPMAHLSMMGFLEIIPKIPLLSRLIKQTTAHIIDIQPDIVITIDSPGFTTRIAKRIQKLNIPLLHYVAPSVWAYKPSRAKKFAAFFDHLLTILPFEAPYFDKVGLDNSYIGHPITESYQKKNPATFRQKHNIASHTTLITLMPGSRHTELARLLPVYKETVALLQKEQQDIALIIPTLPHTEETIKRVFADKTLPPCFYITPEERWEAFASSDLALAKSGTGTLELAMCAVPMVITYKINPLSAFLMRKLIRIRYVNLLNLIADKEIIPEKIQENCTAPVLAQSLLMLKGKAGGKQVKAYQQPLSQLGFNEATAPSKKAAETILALLKYQRR